MNDQVSYRSLYLHFPFCETKCHYCDFYSLGREKTKATDASFFEEALCKELNLRGNEGAFDRTLDTIFLGGGTPSMTPPQSMERIFKTLFQYTSLTSLTEWTMEANPSSITLDQFKAYKALGINRVSMGVQSLNNDHLNKLGRVHNAQDAFQALETLFSAGFTNVSTDLLCGVPGQTLDDLHDHLSRLAQYPITHLSCYLLTLPKHHALFAALPNEEEQLRHLLLIDQFMQSLGFEHYEISNFAKKTTPPHSYQARHNLVYWKGASTNQGYLGFGPSAHSFSPAPQASSKGPSRFKNFSSLHAYGRALLDQNTLPVEWTETLNPEQQELEKWMLALRLADGFPRDWLKTPLQQEKVKLMLIDQLLEPHPERDQFLRATAKGFALSDALIRELA